MPVALGSAEQDAEVLQNIFQDWTGRLENYALKAAGVDPHDKAAVAYKGRGTAAVWARRPAVPRVPLWYEQQLVDNRPSRWWRGTAGRIRALKVECSGSAWKRSCSWFRRARPAAPSTKGAIETNEFSAWSQLLPMLPWLCEPLREAAAAAATAVAERMGTLLARERRDGWLKWLTTSLATNVGAVHKLTKPAAPPQTQDPEKELAEERVQWTAVWGRTPVEGVGLWSEYRDLHAPLLSPLDGDIVQKAAAKMRNRTGMGFDALAPELIKQAPQAAFEELAKLYNEMERRCVAPSTWRSSKICLISKPDGSGRRPIALQAMLYRLYVRARQQAVKDWEAVHSRDSDSAAPGRGAAQAVLRTTAELEVAKEKARLQLFASGMSKSSSTHSAAEGYGTRSGRQLTQQEWQQSRSRYLRAAGIWLSAGPRIGKAWLHNAGL